MNEHLKEESIIPYLDGRVARGAQTLGAHLSVCGECRERVDELRAVMGALAERQLEPPSPAFDAALRARLAEETEQGSGWLVLRPIYGAALAAAVVIASAVALWPPAAVSAAAAATAGCGGRAATEPAAWFHSHASAAEQWYGHPGRPR
jgi:hypothetical protein